VLLHEKMHLRASGHLGWLARENVTVDSIAGWMVDIVITSSCLHVQDRLGILSDRSALAAKAKAGHR